ncbi:hypothetical protein D3C80_1334320 [compost metagenome]
MIARLASLRQQKPALFQQGDYLPLTTTGPHAGNVIAFARSHQDEAVIVAAPRLVFGLNAENFPQAELILPAPLTGRRYHDLLSGQTFTLTDRLDLSEWQGLSPVILLQERV